MAFDAINDVGSTSWEYEPKVLEQYVENPENLLNWQIPRLPAGSEVTLRIKVSEWGSIRVYFVTDGSNDQDGGAKESIGEPLVSRFSPWCQ